MAASARTSGTRAPDESSLNRGSCASRIARAADAARAARRFRAEVEDDRLDAGVFFRLSFFVDAPDDRVDEGSPARVTAGRPRTTTVARRHRARGIRVGRLDIRRSNSLERRWLERGIGILSKQFSVRKGFDDAGIP